MQMQQNVKMKLKSESHSALCNNQQKSWILTAENDAKMNKWKSAVL